MKDFVRSPWLTVTLGIVGLSAGYGLYISMHGGVAHASYFCPATKICNEGKCASDGACDTENCKRCPHCKNEATS